jgi:ATP-dependent Clp protease ATP-binding subunit ClpC
MFERFTDRTRRVLVLAQEEARLLNHGFIGTEHLLLGLIHEGDGVAALALERCGITLEAARNEVHAMVGATSTSPSGSPPFTLRAKKVLELALREALQLGHSYIGTEHILLGLIREGEGVGATVIGRLGVDLGRLRQQVISLMSGTAENFGVEVEGRTPAATTYPLQIESPGLHADPPRCSRCRAGLSEEARYNVIEVPTDDPGVDEGVLSVTVIYCNRCGTALGTA